MRGKLPDADRKRVLLANSALISPLRGQLPPQGKPFQFNILISVYPRFGGVFVCGKLCKNCEKTGVPVENGVK
jgi:hypothetical protein